MNRRLLIVGCALAFAACAETQTPPVASAANPSSATGAQPGLDAKPCLDLDLGKLGEAAAFDRQNQENVAKVGLLEKTVVDLQQQLAAASRAAKPAAPSHEEKGKTLATKKAPPPKPVEPAREPSLTSVAITGNKARIRLPSELLFTLGDVRITRAGRAALAEIATVLKRTPSERIQVNGHTDTSNAGKRWIDNWDLSLARAHEVVMFLIAQGVPPKRLVAAGYADTDPVDTTDSAEARDKNRRVELFIEPTSR